MDFLLEHISDELYIRHAVDDCPDDRDFTMHVHERYEIFCFISGKAEYLVEGARYPLQPGSILIMRPAESHKVKILDGRRYERAAINFTPAVIDFIDPTHKLTEPFDDRPLGRGNLYQPSEFSGMRIDDVVGEICSVAKNGHDSRAKGLTYLFVLLDMINSAYKRRGFSEYAPPQSLPEQIMLYVNTHLFDELSVPQLAKQFYISTSQFNRVFKQAAGASPWEYITIKRLTAAREKIRNGIPAQAACYSCGFRDYSAFYRAYIKHFGCAPKNDS
ncbi:MAG: helix-turn-helix domain-containing protein [Eubacterium sp.]|nr:helix-turn-helix domain-containing protein [Eubacterium sp.]